VTLIDEWRAVALRLWSIRLALFWGAICGLCAVWSAFVDIMPLWVFASGSVLMFASIAGARVLKQPGTE
jgi:hypothetical protein